jgi:hypothetical protein
MSIQHRLEEIKDKKSYSSPAKRIMDHLKPILSKSSEMKKRWIWELMQNATDLGDSIKMRVEIFQDRLVFSHNGKHFTLSEAFDLIMPDSSKDENRGVKKSVIGQFGTGFLSTHILSKKIGVTGVVEENGEYFSFNFNLDRSERTNKNFLIESIKTSENQYRSSLKKLRSVPSGEFQTHFTYFINETYDLIDGHHIVNEGIKTLEELIPYVLTFRPEIEELMVIDHRNNVPPISYQREDLHSDIEGLHLINTIVFQSGKKIEEILMGNILTKEAEIAFPIKRIEENQFRLLPYPKNCPKLFCAFPLIGTHEFSLPFVLNSENFEPNRERDGIDISEHDPLNRQILVQAKDAYLKLLFAIQENTWLNAYHVCRLKSAVISDPADKKWFDSTIGEPLKGGIVEYGLVELDKSLNPDELKDLGSMYFPFVDKSNKSKTEILEGIFNIAIQIIPKEIPGKSTYKQWYNALDFTIFPSEKLDLKNLCELVEPKMKTVAEVSEELKISQESVLDVYKELTRFIISQDAIELLDKHTLIISQSQKFCKLKGLKIDKIKSKGVIKKQIELIKDINFDLSGIDVRDKLIHKNFKSIVDLLDEDETIGFDSFVKETDSLLRDFDGDFKDEDFLLILKDLFSWYGKSEIDEARLSKLMPYFSANKSQLYLNTKTPDELEFAFDIEISGKSEVLAKIAKSKISKEELELFANNTDLIHSFLNWTNDTVPENPDKELGNIGEEFIYNYLTKKFGKDRVIWKDASEYDFIVLEKDIKTVKYYLDAKTTGRAISNSDTVPFFMKMAQWNFLERNEALSKYIIARIFKKGNSWEVKFIKLTKEAV